MVRETFPWLIAGLMPPANRITIGYAPASQLTPIGGMDLYTLRKRFIFGI